jgi:subfamily B ATP-binding cassette protein MsbA
VAVLQDFERDRVPHAGRPAWVRVLAYARPYLGFLGLAVALTLLTSGAEYGRAYLLKILIDEVALPQGAMLGNADLRGWLPDIPLLPGGEAEPAEPSPPPLAGVELDPAQRAELAAQIKDKALLLVALAALIAIALPALGFLLEYIAAYTLGRINVDMMRDACAKLLVLPLSFHHGRRRGDLYSRVGSDLQVAHGALELLFEDVVQAALGILVGLGFLVFVSWQLALALFITGPLLVWVISVFGNRIRRSASRRQEQMGEVTQNLLEILEGIKVIKVFRAEGAEHAAFMRQRRKLFRRSMQVVNNRLLARATIEFMNQALTLGGLCVGGYLLLRGVWGVTLGDLVVFFLISSLIYRPLKRLSKGWVRVSDAMAGAERFLEVLDAPVEIQDAPDAIPLPPASRSIAMRHVTFAYLDEPVLRDVSFEARAGEVVAIVGRTGAGKTTLIDLLMRLRDPQQGSVEIDGIDVRRVTRSSLLGQIGVVTQEPFLFDGSIRLNLLYGRPDATEEEVMAAARAAHVDEFVRDLPNGYETEVGPLGARLSGGQRQRITIARAILRDPAILILDEATSSLDSKSEKYVQEAIDALLGSRKTVFVIAHRLSTVRRADRILVIEKGSITAQGTHEELLAQPGLYSELIELQGLRGAAPAA